MSPSYPFYSDHCLPNLYAAMHHVNHDILYRHIIMLELFHDTCTIFFVFPAQVNIACIMCCAILFNYRLFKSVAYICLYTLCRFYMKVIYINTLCKFYMKVISVIHVQF